MEVGIRAGYTVTMEVRIRAGYTVTMEVRMVFCSVLWSRGSGAVLSAPHFG